MSESTGPIYEVTLSVDPEVIGEFDAWLVNHVEEMLEIPGFARASVFAADDDNDGRLRRVVHYYLDSEADLEQYLAGPAGIMRQSAIDRFDVRFSASRRILHSTDIIDGTLKPLEICLNCKTALSGQYCGSCGQRSRSKLISIWELVQDAFGDLLELDSRVWRTLIPLVASPGKLTREYLEGRRVRFMPPFRTYLVLSIFFFLVAFFDPRQELGFLFEQATDAPAETAQTSDEVEEIRQHVLNDLAEQGIISTEERELTDDASTAEVAATDNDDDDDDDVTLALSSDDGESDCEFDDFENSEVPQWLSTRISKERLIAVCERVIADDGRAFVAKMLDNVPVALFVLLPLMALVLKALYPLSKRYYVEHLLFVVHFHAFFFFVLILQILFARLVALLGLPEAIGDITTFAVSLYVPVYLYKSMRRVYEQGHLITIPKYLVLLAAYFAGFSFIFLFAAVFAAFSI